MNSVAIIGLAKFSLPPQETLKDFDVVWTINNAHSAYSYDTDLIIAMDDFGRDYKTHQNYVQGIVYSGNPVLSTKPDERWPAVEAYPLQKVYDWLLGFHPEPERILDNSCNYALAYAMYLGMTALQKEKDPIGIFGFDWVQRYKKIDLDCAVLRWADAGYDAPDWFKYYEADVLARRRPGEPGVESFHFLFGIARARGVMVYMAYNTTILNQDRDRFFYGYHEQPEIKRD